MTSVIGISNFGLKDSIAWSDECLEDTSFTLTHTLIPNGFLGKILTKQEAIAERVHTGLSWPQEAQVTEKTINLRRAPISVLWRALVESGEHFATWKNPQGIDFSIGKLLAHDIAASYEQVKNDIVHKEEECKTVNISQPQPVIAIPNSLDETGQDALLQECKNLGMPEPYLLWRPVATALSWLKDIENDLLERNSGYENDHIHIFYFGADAFELTTLRLRRYEHNGKTYILPLRDRPTDFIDYSGLDWAGNILESFCSSSDLGAFWQGLTSFPEIWQAIAHEPFLDEALPRPWSTNQGWMFWDPQEMNTRVQQVIARSSNTLHSIISKAYLLKRYENKENFSQQISHTISQFLINNNLPKDGLRGIILCGPLVTQKTMQSWLQEALQPVIQNTDIRNYSTHVSLNTLYLSSGNVSIAEGAKIYGERRLKKIPTYLDTMPQISLYTVTRGAGKWHPLLDAQEVLGGEEFRDVIEKKFSLPKGNNHINIVLCKGAPPSANVNALPEPPKGFTLCEARFIREWVRQQKSYKGVCKALERVAGMHIKQYAETIANHYFNSATPSIREVGTGTTPFRANTVNFSAISQDNIGLDVHVNMKPAAGRARVIFTPRDKNFMGGRSIRMNYDTMRPTHEPSKPQRGWPELLEIVAHPKDAALLRDRNIDLINTFCSINPEDEVYLATIDEIKKKCLSATYQHTWDYEDITFEDIKQNGFLTPHQYTQKKLTLLRLFPFTEDGICCTHAGGDKLAQISEKFSQDFQRLAYHDDVMGIEKLLSRATWLYTKTPVNIIDYIRRNLANNKLKPSMTNTLIESAGKCFSSEEDLRFFFDTIKEKCCSQNYKFNIQTMRSVSRILRYRSSAPDALCRESVAVLAQGTIDIMLQESHQGKYKQKFFQAVVLLLYLLRFRIVNDYFSPSNTEGMIPYHNAIELIQKAIVFFKTAKNKQQADKVQASLEEFEDFIAYKASSAYPIAISEMADENS